jgi:hypothetical protein
MKATVQTEPRRTTDGRAEREYVSPDVNIVISLSPEHSTRAYDRFNALSTARTDASSIFVSTPAPQRVRPLLSLIWM